MRELGWGNWGYTGCVNSIEGRRKMVLDVRPEHKAPKERSKMALEGAVPMAEWLSSCTLLRWPRVLPIRILGMDLAPLIKHTEAASHMPQLE